MRARLEGSLEVRSIKGAKPPLVDKCLPPGFHICPLGERVEDLKLDQERPRGTWSKRLGFIFATAGSAVGLGNIWRFPTIAGESGGAAFVLLYLLFVLRGSPFFQPERLTLLR